MFNVDFEQKIAHWESTQVSNQFLLIATTQPKSTCSKSTTETLEKGVKYVQS